MEKKSSEHPYKNKYSGKYLPFFCVIVRRYFVALFCLLRKLWHCSFSSLMSWRTGIYSSVLNQSVLFNNWISWEVHQLWIYFLHNNIWIPWRMKLLLSGKKNSLLWEYPLSPEQVKQYPKKNIIFTKYLPVAATGFFEKTFFPTNVK